MHPVEFAVLGSYPSPLDPTFMAAIDVAVRLDDGRVVVVGLRSRDYLDDHRDGIDPAWPNGHKPLEVTVDFTSIQHYDFAAILWLGPDPRPCLMWANAAGMTDSALAWLLGDGRSTAVLDGPDGRGLPTAADLGIELPTDLYWTAITTRSNA